MPTDHPVPSQELLDPSEHAFVLIDHQSQMAFATKLIDTVMFRNNASLIRHAASIFGVPQSVHLVRNGLAPRVFSRLASTTQESDLLRISRSTRGRKLPLS
ncbi:hypothetical protein FHR65_002937 [Xanthomonas arboricola]|uniref:Uncharacterized protein n=1 Tax=Xanthomonas arboricola TaxID=56448 RepID=A0AB73GZ86_9XANT|nr:hypothetical protein [Xanthomonas arboricola]